MKAEQTEGTILDRILAAKADEIAARKGRVSPEHMRRRAEAAAGDATVGKPRGLMHHLARGDTVAILAEVKRKSPSKGFFAGELDAAALASSYVRGGAAAVSVLTDGPFFAGSEDDLTAVRAAIPLPVLRKDFIIDDYQVDEARAWGADGVLLIAAALEGSRLTDLLHRAHGLGMDVLVEVHTEQELERALRAGARLIGVNNRDLRTFHTTLDVTLRLAPLVPADVVLVSESGIRTRDDVTRLAGAGVDAILVGEFFVRSDTPETAVRSLSGVGRASRAARVPAGGRP